MFFCVFLSIYCLKGANMTEDVFHGLNLQFFHFRSHKIYKIWYYCDMLSIAICIAFIKKKKFTCHFLQESHLCSVDPPDLSINTLNFITSASSIRRSRTKSSVCDWDQYKKKTIFSGWTSLTLWCFSSNIHSVIYLRWWKANMWDKDSVISSSAPRPDCLALMRSRR